MGIGNWLGKRVRLTDGNFWRGFFGIESWSGEDVSVERALQLDAVWGCVRLVAGTVGTLPCMVYQDDGSTPARDHSLYELLHDAPNLDDTAAEFWETVVLCLMLYGNSYGEIKRNGEGTIVAIDLLHPDNVKVERTSPRNERVYRIREDGKTRTLRDRQIFHVRVFKMPGCDVGMSPVSFARQSIGSALAAEKTTGRMFSNGMQTAGVLTADQVLTVDQRKQIGDIMQQYVGSDKAGKLMVLEAGMKYERLTLTPEDAQMLDTRRFNVESICRWFGVPPVMIGHAATGVTTWGSGVEQIILQFTKTGLRQVVNQIEAAIRRDLLSKDERKTLDVKFNLEGLLRGDSASRAALYSTMVQNGVYSRNHARKLENLPSVDGADVLTVQSNLVPLDQLGKPDAITPARQLESGLAALIGEAVDRALAGAPATTARDKDHQP